MPPWSPMSGPRCEFTGIKNNSYKDSVQKCLQRKPKNYGLNPFIAAK